MPFNQKADGTVITEDTGLNTNPRHYEKRYGIVSRVTGISIVNTPHKIWWENLPAVNPLIGRTDGEETTIYHIHIQNNAGSSGRVWLESGGVRITVEYNISNLNTTTIDFPAGQNVGNLNVDVSASVTGISVQISGTEQTI